MVRAPEGFCREFEQMPDRGLTHVIKNAAAS